MKPSSHGSGGAGDGATRTNARPEMAERDGLGYPTASVKKSSAMASIAKSSTLRRLYLSVYNWVVFFGWAQVLYHATLALLVIKHEAVYPAVERWLLFSQTAALMELLHSALDFVRSPVSVTLPQIIARLYITWGISWSFPEAQSHILATSLFISWAITEVIRYSFFGMKEAFGFAPYWLLWLRYSSFIVCYPIGVISEIGLIYVALPAMKVSEKYCIRMLNKWNFSFDYHYASVLVMALYVPGLPYLFRHMVSQRKKVLSRAKTA